PIAVEDGKEGVQVDGSYYQHGKQQAIASYGRVFAGNSVNAAYYLRDTEYALPKAQLDILVSYLKDTFLKTIRGSFYDFNVRGRGISRQDSLNAHVSGMVNKIKMFNRENSAYWEASTWRTSHQKPANYQIEPSNTVYWKSGYTLQVRPQYTFSVQTASVRTLRTERGNNENVLGKFLSDGATNIQRSGSEYANIMPLWEWDKIPGTTSRDYADDNGSTIKKEWGIPGTTKFVGGVSDGVYGASAYDLDYDSVQAKKAWFFFDKEVVCLGAGINSASSQVITTTINQQNQVGNWYRINQFQEKKEVSGKVFKSWFNHGVQPHDASYAYVVVPDIGAAAMQKYPLDAIKVIQNTKAIQAVMHNRLSIMQVVFYQAGELSYDDIIVKVDKPCIIQVKDLNAINPLIFIADPTQENSKVRIEIKTPKLKSSKIITCNLPVGALAGSTLKYNISN
ncbi:MAG: chondroitinase, partial [Pedobacter sp.]